LTLTGLHLADASIWISTAMSLAVFDISKVVEDGVEIIPQVDTIPGSVRYVAFLSRPALVWIDTLPATPRPSSVLSSLALQLPLSSLNKILTTKMVKPEKHAGMVHLACPVICMLRSGVVQYDSRSSHRQSFVSAELL
jgi:hypothetical protein